MTHKLTQHTTDSFPNLSPEQRQMAFIQERAMLQFKNKVQYLFAKRMIAKIEADATLIEGEVKR